MLDECEERFYISIHTPLARSDFDGTYETNPRSISIHTPLARSDCSAWCSLFYEEISIHTPLARSDFQYLSVSVWE